jgi:hypothetical protein
VRHHRNTFANRNAKFVKACGDCPCSARHFAVIDSTPIISGLIWFVDNCDPVGIHQFRALKKVVDG